MGDNGRGRDVLADGRVLEDPGTVDPDADDEEGGGEDDGTLTRFSAIAAEEKLYDISLVQREGVTTLAVPVLAREGGMLLALPAEFDAARDDIVDVRKADAGGDVVGIGPIAILSYDIPELHFPQFTLAGEDYGSDVIAFGGPEEFPAAEDLVYKVPFGCECTSQSCSSPTKHLLQMLPSQLVPPPWKEQVEFTNIFCHEERWNCRTRLLQAR